MKKATCPACSGTGKKGAHRPAPGLWKQPACDHCRGGGYVQIHELDEAEAESFWTRQLLDRKAVPDLAATIASAREEGRREVRDAYLANAQPDFQEEAIALVDTWARGGEPKSVQIQQAQAQMVRAFNRGRVTGFAQQARTATPPEEGSENP